MEIKDRFFVCQCHGEGIVVSPLEYKGEVEEVCISLWRLGAGDYGITAWRNRLRYIWHIIKHGHPYTDDVVLSLEQVRELEGYLEAARHGFVPD